MSRLSEVPPRGGTLFGECERVPEPLRHCARSPPRPRTELPGDTLPGGSRCAFHALALAFAALSTTTTKQAGRVTGALLRCLQAKHRRARPEKHGHVDCSA